MIGRSADKNVRAPRADAAYCFSERKSKRLCVRILGGELQFAHGTYVWSTWLFLRGVGSSICWRRFLCRAARLSKNISKAEKTRLLSATHE
jgi:hypothetical protein